MTLRIFLSSTADPGRDRADFVFSDERAGEVIEAFGPVQPVLVGVLEMLELARPWGVYGLRLRMRLLCMEDADMVLLAWDETAGNASRTA